MFKIRHRLIRFTIWAERHLDIAAAELNIKKYLAGLTCLCLLAAAPLAADRPGTEEFFVYGLTADQKNFNMTASWEDAGCDEYTVIVSQGLSRKVQTTKDTHSVIKDVKPGKKYKITVLGTKKGTGTSEAATMKKTAVKERQPLKTAKTAGEGFKGNSLSVKTRAPGKVHYESTNSNVAKVDDDGNVTLKEPGHAQIIIRVAGTDMYKAATARKDINVYPEKMDTPEGLAIAEKDGSCATLEWEKVDFAKGYRIYRKNEATGEYELYAETDSADTSIEFTRDAGQYKVMAVAVVGDETVESDMSEDMEVTPASEEARSYSSLTRLGTIDFDSVEKTVSIPQDYLTLQSMCVTEDSYIVVLSARNGSSGKLVRYSFDGKKLDEADTGSIGHGNGCAYDPNTKTIYIALSYSKKKIAALAAFDEETLERKDDIKLGSSPSAIAYDRYTDSFYMKDGGKFIVTDGNMMSKKEVPRFSRNIAQDIGAYNGLILSSVWNGGYSGSVDLYREEDGAYLGTYAVDLGEIESVSVQDGKFVFLVNDGINDAIYITKEAIDFSL